MRISLTKADGYPRDRGGTIRLLLLYNRDEYWNWNELVLELVLALDMEMA